jgi:hypothetical protein
MLAFNADRVRENARKADTEDLLDRATVYRDEMEPEALRLIDAELAARAITVEQVREHLEARRSALTRPDGAIQKCAFCHRPALSREWRWHLLFGKIPVFPRRVARCLEHGGRAAVASPKENDEGITRPGEERDGRPGA